MVKKLGSILLALLMMVSLSACSDSNDDGGNTGSSDIKIKTTADFVESDGIVKYFTIEDQKFAIPETVGEYANYLETLGTVTLNDTGENIDDVELDAGGVSSMVAYLNVETEDGDNAHFYVRYENKTDDTISVSQASVTRIEVKYDVLSENDFDKVFDSVVVTTDKGDFELDNKTDIHDFYDELGDTDQATDGRLTYNSDNGYKYTFDCCNENAEGIFRGFIIEYPTES